MEHVEVCRKAHDHYGLDLLMCAGVEVGSNYYCSGGWVNSIGRDHIVDCNLYSYVCERMRESWRDELIRSGLELDHTTHHPSSNENYADIHYVQNIRYSTLSCHSGISLMWFVTRSSQYFDV